jgi:hypothetical protein
MLANSACDIKHTLQIRTTIFARRSAYGYDEEFGVGDGGRRIGAERQSSCSAIYADHIVKAGLIYRDLAPSQPFNLGSIDIDANNFVANLGETRAGDQPDMACTKNCDIQI